MDTTSSPTVRRRQRLSRSSLACAIAVLTTLLPVASASAVQVPAGFTTKAYRFTLVAATALAPLPDGRILVAQQGGALRVVKNGVLLSTPMLTVAVDSRAERGLLGVAPHPRFATNGQVFVHYTVPSTAAGVAHARIERWTVPAGSDRADPASRKVLLDLPGVTNRFHNGGGLHFGSDGKLLVAIGDNGASAGSQRLDNPFGKVLRIEPTNGAAAAGNPFIGSTNQWARRIWAYGLRNPFTFGVSTSGRVHINDVGQDTWEEINLGRSGANYGWPASEGPDNVTGFTAPMEFYDHSGGCSIAGGGFYEPRSVRFPTSHVGDYFYGDFCGGWVRSYDVATDTSTPFASDLGSVVDIAVAPGGRMFVLTRTGLWLIDHP